MRLPSMVGFVALTACSFQPSGGDEDPVRPDASVGGAVDARPDPRTDASTPGAIDAPTPRTIRIEAEAWDTLVPGPGLVTWTSSSSGSRPGFTGTGYAVAPNRWCAPIDAPCACIAVYPFDVPVSGQYRVVLRHAAIDVSQDSVWWGIDVIATITLRLEDLDPEVGSSGGWVDDTDTVVVDLDAGPHRFSLFLREGNVPVDAIQLIPM